MADKGPYPIETKTSSKPSTLVNSNLPNSPNTLAPRLKTS